MKQVFGRLFVVTLFVGMFASADVQAGWGGSTPAPDPVTEPCVSMNADVCFHQGDWWWENYSNVGGVLQHTLTCALSTGCKTCGFGGPYYLTPECVRVTTNASCECEIQQATNSSGTPAPGITNCSATGECIYRGY